ncbi:MAG TPA: arylamine N-acetyltransferase [Blastocatellia bacterium]|nr:arylamine N-acetyltransferase [Blastocatellia bacterium]
MEAMDVSSYLKRIDYRGNLDLSAATLRELHKAHLLSVPFENLDVHFKRPIVLDEKRMVSKIVEARRGGICYELNTAFCSLLRGLGFRVSILSAGVARDQGGFDPPFDHMTLLVHLQERWLADVGFGDSFREPLRLDVRGPQDQNGESYRIVDADEHLIVERQESDLWKPQYRFTLDPYALDAFDEMCRYHQTSPESPFTRKRVCTRATPDGRITVTGMRLIVTEKGKKQEIELTSREEWTAALREHFGVEVENRL